MRSCSCNGLRCAASLCMAYVGHVSSHAVFPYSSSHSVLDPRAGNSSLIQDSLSVASCHNNLENVMCQYKFICHPSTFLLHEVQNVAVTQQAGQYAGEQLKITFKSGGAPAEAAAMICAAASGCCVAVVARAVARVEAKGERASGLPAATLQNCLKKFWNFFSQHHRCAYCHAFGVSTLP